MTSQAFVECQGQDLFAKLAAAANLRVNLIIERATIKAKEDLHMPVDLSAYDKAKKRLSDETPLFATSFEIRGQVCRDMYDHVPGFAYFYTNGVRRFTLPPYTSLSNAKQHAIKQLRAMIEEFGDEDEEYDGQFTPTYIVLFDQFKRVIQESTDIDSTDAISWKTDYPSQEEWGTLEQRASELASEAALEAGWDNHDTATRLRAQYDAIHRKVQAARLLARIVQ